MGSTRDLNALKYSEALLLGAGRPRQSGVQLFDLAIFGIRAPSTHMGDWDDFLCIRYQDADGWALRVWPGTTEPGTEKGSHPGGVFTLAPGHYPLCWEYGKHKGQYDALVQRPDFTSFKGWRDTDINGRLPDRSKPPTHSDVRGLNMHFAKASLRVGNWSLACQVFQKERDFLEAMVLARAQQGRRYSYTLIQATDDVYTRFEAWCRATI